MPARQRPDIPGRGHRPPAEARCPVVARLEPPRLRTLLTAPQAVFAFEAREVVKDIVLGREPKEER